MRSIEWLGNAVRFIDQTKLPLEESSVDTSDYRVIAEAIRMLKIRGAPLIGIAAAYGVALAALGSKQDKRSEFENELLSVIDELGSTRPTAVNLRWALEKIRAAISDATSIEEIKIAVTNAAIEIHRDDEERCKRIGKFGAAIIKSPVSILTHCNTGALATGGEGTALSVIKHAYRKGNVKQVFVDETRPLLQGARLTTWELQKENIPCTLITDNMAASLMKDGKVDLIITGADRIASNGDTANKIGTYSLAVLAKYHTVPFYIAAPTSTIDSSISNGTQIPIEQRSPDEVTQGFGKRIAPEHISVHNPAFDVTPAELIAAIITDEGIVYPPYGFGKKK